jgi:hypothetical protein
MKYIITESKLERIAITWLNDIIGPLIPNEVERLDGYFSYRGKGRKLSTFDYDTRKNKNVVYFKDALLIGRFQSAFPFNNKETKEIIQKWFEENYDLDFNRMDFKSFTTIKD